ncbi:TIGR03084 family metal-binding protein [Streptomyces sp. NBC_00234]|uniref:TIGR03084 family metal-binding protein n=1 Tax=Streptomyces sp. NBC_00234 TaxID=2903638 RepID=UPI002E2DE24F|nr:TIGR03084 family metal-binding protein [Streptomyces sp. NBC_00234]
MSDAAAVSVLDDLREESDELDALVAGLSAEAWAGPTPAERWTVAHQIAHLAWTDEVALLAVTDPGAFADEVGTAMADPDSFVDRAAADLVAVLEPDALLARWRDGRNRLQEALRAAAPGTRFPWYGPPMGVASMATARLMETWAHGQDVADALGVTRAPTGRLRHVARIGVRARDYAYFVRGTKAPEEEFRVELLSPEGELITYGPENAEQRVTGPLYDFCLLVTQRAHRDDLAVRAVGTDADQWLDIAQAFAGPAGTGRPARKDR